MEQKNNSPSNEKLKPYEFDELFDQITQIIKDSNSISVLTELLINGSVTVNELKEKPSIKNTMKKSLLYSTLKDLEKNGLISSKYEVQTTESDRGYAFKKFSLQQNFINLLDQNLTELSVTKPKESRIFGLYMIRSFLNRELDRILNLTNEELKNNENEIHGGYGGAISLNKNEFSLLQQKIVELIPMIKKDSSNLSSDRIDDPYGFYFGFYYLPEKDTKTSNDPKEVKKIQKVQKVKKISKIKK